MKSIGLKWSGALLLGLVVFLQGCISVNSGSIQHGLTAYNHGTTKIENIVVLYGDRTINLGGVHPAVRPDNSKQGSSWGVWTHVPPEMTVTWQTSKGGPVRRVTVPLKASWIQQLRNWEIHFFPGDVMEVWREQLAPPATPHNPFKTTESVRFFSTKGL